MKEEKAKKLLSSCRLFDGVRLDGLPYESGFCAEHYEKGQTVLLDGSLFLVISGKVRVGGEGGGRAVINELPRGAVFGYASLCGGGFAGEVRAAGGAALLRILPETVEALLSRDPAFAKNIIAAQAEKIRFLNRRIASFTAPDAAAKLQNHLRSLASAEGEIDLPLCMSALARRLGMGRASLYRAFEKLEGEGVIEKIGDKRYRFIDKTGPKGRNEHENNL